MTDTTRRQACRTKAHPTDVGFAPCPECRHPWVCHPWKRNSLVTCLLCDVEVTLAQARDELAAIREQRRQA